MLASAGGASAFAGVLKRFRTATLSRRMSSRQEEKERRRREREEREAAERAKAARGRRLQMVFGALLALIVIGGGIGLVLALTGGGDDTASSEVPAGSAAIPAPSQGDLTKAAA